jgi:hypothetical protein
MRDARIILVVRRALSFPRDFAAKGFDDENHHVSRNFSADEEDQAVENGRALSLLLRHLFSINAHGLVRFFLFFVVLFVLMLGDERQLLFERVGAALLSLRGVALRGQRPWR